MRRGTADSGSRFPDPASAGAEDFVCYGPRLDVPTLVDAYGHGIFPWPVSPRHLVPWCSPALRGVIDFDRFHLPRRLARTLRTTVWTTRIDTDFDRIIRACAAQPRPGQRGTWITAELMTAYEALYVAGHAHCIGCYDGDRLVGGLYGVYVAGAFSAESMFHAETDASKVCLVRLVEVLRALGLRWLDIQTLTSATAPFGAIEIPRDEFLRRLAAARASSAPWPPGRPFQ